MATCNAAREKTLLAKFGIFDILFLGKLKNSDRKFTIDVISIYKVIQRRLLFPFFNLAGI